MSIHIVCDSCNSSYNLKDELAGKKAKCSKCGNIFEIVDTVEIIEIEENTTASVKTNSVNEENDNLKTEKATPNTGNEEKYKTIKPKIIKSLIFLSAGLPILFLIFVILILSLFIIPTLADDKMSTAFFGLFIIVAFFLIIAYIGYWIKKRALEKISYKFYENKIEYYDGFLVKNRKTVKISRITDVSQQRGIIERMFGLGTVNISTAGSVGYEISMSYLAKSDDVYDFIDNLVSKYEENKNSGVTSNKNIASENKISREKENKNENIEEKSRVIKPQIINSLIFINAIGSTFIWLFIIAIFAWQLLLMIDIFILLIFFILFTFVSYFFSKKQLEKISYKFYENKIEYYDGFLVKNKKTVKISKITDVSQKRGIIERMFGLGTIGLSTAGSHGNQINMYYLEQSDEVYKFIDGIVSANDS